MMIALFCILVGTLDLADAVSQTHSTISSQGRILRTASRTAGDDAIPKEPSVGVFIVTTPDEEHVTMLRNLLCSLFSRSGEAAQQQEITVMLHPGHGATDLTAHDLQQSLQSIGYTRLSVLDSQKVFGGHPHWSSLKDGFPSNLRVFGIRHVLANMPPDSHLLVIDEDVVCSPERVVGETSYVNIPEEVVRQAPAGASVVCAHEVPGVTDVFNNGFCLYKASDVTDAFLGSVEKKMVQLQFPGDQTPFNLVVREGADLPVIGRSASSTSVVEESSMVKASSLVANFGAGVVGYLRTWTSDGFPHVNTKELRIVDSAAPDTLVQWNVAPTSASKPLPGPLCLHYLPFSPTTHVWSKLQMQC